MSRKAAPLRGPRLNDVNAVPARTWLARAGIDIDSAVNGVFLPVAHADDTGDATVHVGPTSPAMRRR